MRWLRRSDRPVLRVQEAPSRQVQEGLLPRYHVILHNDDMNGMHYVVHCLLRCVPSLTPEQATAIMLEAHHHGQAVVITCPLEPAELYRERLESCGLTATIERA
ncbi:MAG: ATP-dependent Clp protease adapter ClpS [Chloroflexi bacterium]|nr:ATP-dependent Clp protease adapter ClpS [Chloroflexota bacterium]